MKATSLKRFKPRRYAFTYELLHELRQVKGLSFPQIARKFGCDQSTVRYALIRLGVKTDKKLVGPVEKPVIVRARAEKYPEVSRQIAEWPHGIRFEDVQRRRSA